MMSTSTGSTLVALRRAAVRATLAPSVHNTQPWKLHLKDGRLGIYVDRARRLTVLDPSSRQLLLSCGCALTNARVSLAASGVAADVRRTPHPMHDDLMASITVSDGEPDRDLAALDAAIERRQTNRRHFDDERVPDSVLETLELAARDEDCILYVVDDPDKRDAVARISQLADQIENLNPAYRAELRAWTSDEPERRDGVAMLSVPHVDGNARDDVPMRDFDTSGRGWLPAMTGSSKDQTLVLLCTVGDSPAEWFRSGEALERVLLEITRLGYVASPLTQVTEVASARARLRNELRLVAYPHILLRIGRAPVAPTSRRRRLTEVLIDES